MRAQVAGLAPSLLANWRLMVFQAFVDESGKDDIFAMAGYVASAEQWAAFARDWERLLKRHGTLSAKGIYHFHMTEMMMTDERKDNVKAFYRVIEKHALFGFGVSFRKSELARVQKNFTWGGKEVDFGPFVKPYAFAYRFLMDQFHKNLDEPGMIEYLPTGSTVDFYFDEQTAENSAIWANWNVYLSNQPDEMREKYGRKPRFEKDHVFLPLQAADFAAWYARIYHRRGGLGYFARKGGSSSVKASKPLMYACLALSIHTIQEICEDLASNA